MSFSFKDKLLIETPVVKILPSFFAFFITFTVFLDDILSFLETLEDDDDVQNVYSNVKFKN